MNKFLILLILLIAFAVTFYIYKKVAIAPQKQLDWNYQEKPEFKPTVIPTEPAVSPSPTKTINNQDGLDAIPQNTGSLPASSEESVQVYEVAYDGQVFNPQTQKIKVNDYVFFINNSSGDFWPYSADADHTSLNSQKNILPTKQYKFQFKQAGTWVIKDKFNNQAVGKIIVE